MCFGNTQLSKATTYSVAFAEEDHLIIMLFNKGVHQTDKRLLRLSAVTAQWRAVTTQSNI